MPARRLEDGIAADRPGADPRAEDLAFARAIAKAEPAAMRRAVDEFLPLVHGVARRLLGNGADADEVAQETFLRVWRHAGRWTPRGARLSSWVTRIAINLCYDRLRRAGRMKSVTMDAVPEMVDGAAGALTVLMQADRRAALERAMAALPARQRLAIQLVHIEEMTNIDAAAAMDVSVEALESLLARGRRALRARLAGERDELLGEMP